MAKLGPITRGGIKLTQALHGVHQGGKAIDFISPIGSYDIIAPCDVEVKKQLYDNAAKTPYFEIFNSNFKIQLVHCLATVSPGIYPKGAVIGTYKVLSDRYPEHIHGAIQVAGKWGCILDYTDRTIPLTLSSGFKPNEQFWGRWSYYADLQLVIQDLVPDVPPVIPPVTPPTNELEKRVKELEKSMTEIFNISKKSING